MSISAIPDNDPTSASRKGGALPAIPKFDSFEEERKHIKKILAVVCRVFASNGYTDGIGGYIVIRDPEFTDTYWVNPMGLDFSRVTVSSLVRVNSNGDVVEGRYPASRPAWATFTVIRKMRPEIVAAAHVHSHYGSAWSTFGLPIDYVTEDNCIFYNNLSVYTQFNGAIVTQSEGYNMAKCLGKNKAIILQNHGIYTVGETLEEAAWLFMSLENACKTQFLLEGMKAKGIEPKQMSQAALDFTSRIMGSSYSAWVQFYPIVEKTLHNHPDIES